MNKLIQHEKALEIAEKIYKTGDFNKKEVELLAKAFLVLNEDYTTLAEHGCPREHHE